MKVTEVAGQRMQDGRKLNGSCRATLPPGQTSKRIHSNIGSLTTSSGGTGSTACPALRQARRPPEMTNTLNPSLSKICATRALVASRAHVQ